MKVFPTARDLATDVSWNYEVKKQTKPFKPRPPDVEEGTWRMQQSDAERVQEFRKCIECFLCQDVCHVLRDHRLHHEFIGPRFFVYSAALEMNPLDTEDRTDELANDFGVGYCNITAPRRCLSAGLIPTIPSISMRPCHVRFIRAVVRQQVLHQGMPRGDHHHRQRDHSAQGAGGRQALRSAEPAAARFSDIAVGRARPCRVGRGWP